MTDDYIELDGGKCHQRLIRESEAKSDEGGLFGRLWEAESHDIKTAVVREVNYSTAKEVIDRYEWLGTMPAVVLHCYGLYFGDACAGVVVYSPEYIENLGAWDSYGYTGKIILLARGACVHWAHEHSASKLIRGSMKLLPKRYRVVTATVDASAGEIGTIYQACGFDYVGVMSAGGNRATIITDKGSHISGRQARRDYSTEGVIGLRTLGVSVESVARKGRYFGFIGPPKEVAKLRSAIAGKIKPYPKRAAQAKLIETD